MDFVFPVGIIIENVVTSNKEFDWTIEADRSNDCSIEFWMDSLRNENSMLRYVVGGKLN